MFKVGTDSHGYYPYTAYANDNIGTGFTYTWSEGLEYSATIFTTTQVLPLVENFNGKWVKFVGTDGLNGTGVPVGPIVDGSTNAAQSGAVWEKLSVSGGINGNKKYFGNKNMNPTSGVVQNFCIPYTTADGKNYRVITADFSASTATILTPIPVKIVICNTVYTGNDITSIVVSSIYDAVLTSSKRIDLSQLNISLSSTQTMFLWMANVSDVSANMGYSQTNAYTQYSFTIPATLPTVGRTYTDRLTAFKIDISLIWEIEEYQDGMLLGEYVPISEKKVLKHNNGDALMLLGSSLTESLYCPFGYSWAERINDLVDIPIINNGYGGSTREYGIRMLANSLPMKNGNGLLTGSVSPSYVMWLNSANNSDQGLQGYSDLTVCKYVTEAIGAKMVMGTEEKWDNGAEELAVSFATNNNIPFESAQSIIEKCSGTITYSGAIYQSHRGWRLISPYLIYEQLINQLPIRQSLKMFRPRPSLVIGSIPDLTFDTINQRAIKYYAVGCGSGHTMAGTRYIDFRSADTMDAAQYDIPSSDTIDDTNIAESASLMAGNSINFTDYALIDAVLDVSLLDYFTFEFESVNTIESVYVLSANFGTYPSSAISLNSKFIQIPHSQAGNKIICQFAGRVPIDILIGSKVSILIYCSGSFSIAFPKITYGGPDKKQNSLTYAGRKFGENILADTSMNGNWTLFGGAIIDSLPVGIRQYTTYNAVQSHVKLGNNATYIARAFNSSLLGATRKIAIRIVAQVFYPIMTTKYVGDSAYDGYVNSTSTELGKRDFDYGEITLTINDQFISKLNVCPGWMELYCELQIPTRTTGNLTIKIQPSTNSSSKAYNKPILIHDVSIQKIQ